MGWLSISQQDYQNLGCLLGGLHLESDLCQQQHLLTMVLTLLGLPTLLVHDNLLFNLKKNTGQLQHSFYKCFYPESKDPLFVASLLATVFISYYN